MIWTSKFVTLLGGFHGLRSVQNTNSAIKLSKFILIYKYGKRPILVSSALFLGIQIWLFRHNSAPLRFSIRLGFPKLWKKGRHSNLKKRCANRIWMRPFISQSKSVWWFHYNQVCCKKKHFENTIIASPRKLISDILGVPYEGQNRKIVLFF